MKNIYSRLFISAVFLSSFHLANAQVKYDDRKITVTDVKTNDFDEATVRQKMRADGLTDPVIDKLLAQQKLWKKKGTVTWSNVKSNNTPVINAPCNGLGVESGWGAWQWQKGSNSGANPPVWSGPLANNPTPPDFTITAGAGIDPNTPSPAPATNPTIPVVAPGFGNNSIKIGDDCSVGSVCQQLTYPLTVTAQDTNFVFAYAVVIEDAGHLPSEQPFCEIVIYDSGGNPIQCVPLIYTGGPNIPGFFPVSGTGCAYGGVDQYKPWTLVGVNLNPYVGQNLTVVITNCDCIYGGHFCYSYWDFLCGTSQLSAGCFGNQSSICGPVDPQIAYTYTWYNNGVPIPPPMGTQQCITITPSAGDTITVAVHQPSGCDFHLTYVPASIYPNFTYTNQCGVVTFSDSSWASPSSVNITGWNWSFIGGNPATANTSSATVTYTTAGNYTVALTVTCSAGCTATYTNTITVSGLPTAAFAVSTVCAGNPTQFTDNSSSNPSDPIVSWNWSFPSGTPATSTTQNPSVTYPVGNYAATLTVTTQGGCKAIITQSITVNPMPVPLMTGNNVCFNNATTFQDLSTGNNTVSNWSWNFGDGSALNTTQNPSHTYATSGTFSVSLVVTNNFGCKDSTVINIIVNPLPVSNFTFTPVCFGDPTCFQDLSNVPTGNVTAWSWNFNDPNSGPANISNLQNPCHTFTGQGPYNVILTVTSDSGCQSTTIIPATINPLPVANFTNTSVCMGSNSSFTDGSSSTPNVNGWMWNFGDPTSASNTSTSQNPSHIFSTSGNYTVTLIITNPNGCKDTVDKPVIVYSPPVAIFINPDSGCSPVQQQFSDLSTSTDGSITVWQWSFPGGNPSAYVGQNGQSTWTTPGSYGVQLIVTTQYGCSDTLFIPNYINVYDWPKADFCVAPAQASVNQPVFNFCPLWSSDVTQWIWDFGDGSATNAISTNPIHSYSAVATNNDFYTYNVCINVKNVHGCYDTICHTVDLLPEYEFYIPNCVTPNQDGINDFFFGKSRGVKDYDIWVFDRWGNLIWDCHYQGKNTDWDNYMQDGMSSACKWDAKVEGGNSNQIVQEDVYVWKVRLTDIFDKKHSYIGHVSVVK